MSVSMLLSTHEHIHHQGSGWLWGIPADWNYRAFLPGLLADLDWNEQISSCRLIGANKSVGCEAYLFDYSPRFPWDSDHLGGSFVFLSSPSDGATVLSDLRQQGFNDETNGILLVNTLAAPWEQRVSLGPMINAALDKFRPKPEDYIGGGGGLFSSSYGIYSPEVSWIGCPTFLMGSRLSSDTNYLRIRVPIKVTVNLILGFTDDYACAITLWLAADRLNDKIPTLVVNDVTTEVESGFFSGKIRDTLKEQARQLRSDLSKTINAEARKRAQPAIDNLSAQGVQVRLRGTYLLPGDRTDRIATSGTGTADGNATLVAKYELVGN